MGYCYHGGGVFDEVHTQFTTGFWTYPPPPPPFPNPPFYAHVRFWVTPFPMCDAYIKLPCQPTQNSTTM